MVNDRQTQSAKLRAKSHMPETLFYERIVPALLIFMGIVMLALILVAFAVIFGHINL